MIHCFELCQQNLLELSLGFNLRRLHDASLAIAATEAGAKVALVTLSDVEVTLFANILLKSNVVSLQVV